MRHKGEIWLSLTEPGNDGKLTVQQPPALDMAINLKSLLT